MCATCSIARLPSELDFDKREVARQLNLPTECGAGLGQHRFCKRLGRYMGEDEAIHCLLLPAAAS